MKEKNSSGSTFTKSDDDCYQTDLQKYASNFATYLSEFERLHGAKDETIKHLETEKANVIQTVKEMKKQLLIYVDQLESDAIETANRFYDTECNEIERQRDNLEAMAAKAKVLLLEIKKQADSGLTEVDYSSHKLYDNNFDDFRSKLMSIHQNSFSINVTFEPNDKLKCIMKKLKTFGKLTVMKSKMGCVLPRTSMLASEERKALTAGEIKVKFPADLKTPSIHEVCLLQNGNILVCDDNNLKLKLFDHQNKPLSAVILSSTPYGVTLLNQNEAMITLPTEKRLNIVDVGKELVIKKRVVTKHLCGPIAKYNENNVVVFAEGKDHNYLNLMDQKGRTIKCIRKEIKNNGKAILLHAVTDITVNAKDAAIYVTDLNRGCIGLSMDGHLLFSFSSSQVMGYSGVCTTPEGDLFVCGNASNNVVLVNKEGQMLKELVNSNLVKPTFVTYCHRRNQLFVTQVMSDTTKLFNLL